MENTAATPIHLLRPYTKVLKIKVRVCRIWRPRFPGSVEKYLGLRCILVDEMQHAVEACTADIDYEIIASKTEAGGCYEIMDFRVNKMRGQYRVVPHDTQVVFTGKTTFKKLTNIMGRITVVQHLKQKQINQRIEPKCDIIIQNIRLLLLFQCCINYFAYCVNIFFLLFTLFFRCVDNIVLNSTGSSLFFIDPDIVELNAYKSVFANCTEAVKKLPPSSKHANEAEVLQAAKKVTIEELAFLDPDLHKDDTFLCKACVKRFDTRYDWWYSACPNCAKQMYKVNLVLEDETNETNALIIGKSGEKLFGSSYKDLQLPNEFSRLIGQKKIFHLRFGTRKNNLNTNDLLISNVSEDTTVQPTTPQALLTEITVTSTNVSSSTSTPETTAQSHQIYSPLSIYVSNNLSNIFDHVNSSL
ncbi:unnamed protein product [Malus baccata var. baccata]